MPPTDRRHSGTQIHRSFCFPSAASPEHPHLVVQSQQAPPSVCPELDVRGSSNQAAGQLTVVTGNNVPILVSRESQDRPFVAMVRGAKAALQIAGLSSLTWLALVQRVLRLRSPIGRPRLTIDGYSGLFIENSNNFYFADSNSSRMR